MSIWLEDYTTTGDISNLSQELSSKEYNEKFGTFHGFSHDLLFLDSGEIFDRSTWNGDEYYDRHENISCVPIIKETGEEDDTEVVGYDVG